MCTQPIIITLHKTLLKGIVKTVLKEIKENLYKFKKTFLDIDQKSVLL